MKLNCINVPIQLHNWGHTSDGSGMGAMLGAMQGAMGTKIVDFSIKEPSNLQKMCNKKIPDFLSEYVKKYGKDDNEKVYALWVAYSSFCYNASESLDEQVLSI